MTKKKKNKGRWPASDYADTPGGAAGLVKVGKLYGLACKYPGCLCASKCLRQDKPFCVECGAPEHWCRCDEFDGGDDAA